MSTRRPGVAYGLETGVSRHIDVLAVEPVAVDVATVCRLVGHAPSHATMAKLRAKPGFPKPITPSGEDRYILAEVREWIASLPRVSERRTWSDRRRAVAALRRVERSEVGVQ